MENDQQAQFAKMSKEHQATIDAQFPGVTTLKGLSRQIKELAAQLKLSEKQIQNHLTNRSRKGKKYTKPGRTYARGPSAYNVFCEQAESDVGTGEKFGKDWASQWKQLDGSQKEKFFSEAKKRKTEVPATDKEKLAYINHYMAVMRDSCTALQAIGVETGGVSIVNSQPAIFGTQLGVAFLNKDKILSEMCCHFMCLEPISQRTDRPENRKDLEKGARSVLNAKFEKFLGKPGNFPYQELREGLLNIEGWPEGVRKVGLERLSVPNLEALIAAADQINITGRQPRQKPTTDSCRPIVQPTMTAIDPPPEVEPSVQQEDCGNTDTQTVLNSIGQSQHTADSTVTGCSDREEEMSDTVSQVFAEIIDHQACSYDGLQIILNSMPTDISSIADYQPVVVLERCDP